MLDWDELRFFLAVCRSGSFAAAARELRVDQTTVARRVARLESTLGARLLGRTPDGLSLTTAGEPVRASAEEMERSALEMERRAMGSDRALAGRVRITVPELLGIHFVLPALKVVRQRHPGVVVELLPTMARLDLARAEADVAVRTVRPSEAGLFCKRLGSYAMATYLRRGRPLEPLVVFTESSRPRMRSVDQRLPDAAVALRASSSSAVLEAVRLGLGAGDVPCFIGDADRSLVRAFPGEPPEQLELWLVTHGEVRRTARVRAVSRILEEAFSGSAAALQGR